MGPAPVLGPSLFLLSAAILSYEVVLLRLFSIQTYHHFAFMVIGIALLGFGASGTALVLVGARLQGREGPTFFGLTAVAALAMIAAPAVAATLRFEPTQLLWDSGQWWAVGAVYVTLTVPFLLAAGAIGLALMGGGAWVGRLYGWNLVGAGCGGILAPALLAGLRPERALVASILPAALATVVAVPILRKRGSGLTLAGLVLAVVVVSLASPPFRPVITPFKGLPQVEAYPGSTRLAEAWGPTGWVAAVEAPAFRHAPGLSLGFTGELPRQIALFVDGELVGASTAARAGTSGTEFLDALPSAAPFAVTRPGSVLVLGAGGGLEVLNALSHGAARVTAVERVGALPSIAETVLEPRRGVFIDARVRLVTGDARGFVARSKQRFDVIVLPGGGAAQGSGAGIHGAGEDYVHTVEAFRDYLDRLAPGGIVASTAWLMTPPRANVKLLLTAAEALRDAEVDDVGGSIAFVRSWATGTLLVKPGGFRPDDVQLLRQFATRRGFDVDWPPLDEAPHTVFNAIERPVFAQAIRAAADGAGGAESFARSYPFHVVPATDDRPYFGRSLPLTSLPALLRDDRGSWLPFAEWGYLAVVATLVQSALLALLLLAVPAAVWGRRGDPGRRLAKVAAYFAAIGLGYMFLEIAAIHRLTLVLGDPVYAASATLAGLLTFSGLGSALSDRLPPRTATRVCLAVAALAVGLALAAPSAGGLARLSLAGRITAATFLVGAPGLFMGGPFPLGLRRLAPGGRSVAWAWAANGVASVVGASLATMLAMETGSRGLILAAGACYATAAVLSIRRRSGVG